MLGWDVVVLSKSRTVTPVLFSPFSITFDRYKSGVCRGVFTIKLFFASFWMYIVGFPIWIELTFDAFDDGVSSNSFVNALVLLGLLIVYGFVGVWGETIGFYFLSASIFEPLVIFFSNGGDLSLARESVVLVGVLLFIRGMGGLSLIFSWWTGSWIKMRKYIWKEVWAIRFWYWISIQVFLFPQILTYYHRRVWRWHFPGYGFILKLGIK